MKILNVSDIHLDIKRPVCRTDADWLESQQELADFVVRTAIMEEVDYIVDNGDTFDTAVQPLTVINVIPNALRKYNYKVPWICMPGNHSLQFHQMKNLPKSALSSFGLMEGVTLLENCNEFFEAEFLNIPIVHRLIFPDLKSVPWYMQDKGTFEHAEMLLDKYPQNDLILTGDYHHSFHFEKDGRHVVNPGCLNIQDAGMIGYQPKIAIIEYEPNIKFSIKWIDVPDQIEETTNEHILKIVESEKGIMEVLETLKEPEKLTMKFWLDMETYLATNEIEESLSNYILQKVQLAATTLKTKG
jgi:DNA repair exonuclease SbcCD nuclease subunit